MSFQKRPISDLHKLPGNPRTIKDKAFKTLCESIKNNPDYFEARPVILSNRTGKLVIIAGNQRFEAAKSLGLKEVPSFLMENLTKEKEDEIVIRDNVNNGEWDMDALANQWDVQKLSEWGLDFEFEEQAPKDKKGDEENVPEIDESNIFVQAGDVFQLGEHKIILGDATKGEDISKLMGDELLDCIWTDPPYNVNYEGNNGMKIKNDSMEDNAFFTFLYDAYVNMFTAMKAGAPIYVAHADTEGLNFRRAFKEAGFKLSGCLIWNKPNFVLGRSDYQWKHEPILYGWKEGEAHKWFGKRNKTTVLTETKDFLVQNEDGSIQVCVNDQWFHITGQNLDVAGGDTTMINHDKPAKSDLHPTMKPIGLIEKMLLNSTRKGSLVGDFFSGSGSTLITCEKLGRKARVVEFDPVYFQRTLMRYHEYVGGEKEIKCLNREIDLTEFLNGFKSV